MVVGGGCSCRSTCPNSAQKNCASGCQRACAQRISSIDMIGYPWARCTRRLYPYPAHSSAASVSIPPLGYPSAFACRHRLSAAARVTPARSLQPPTCPAASPATTPQHRCSVHIRMQPAWPHMLPVGGTQAFGLAGASVCEWGRLCTKQKARQARALWPRPFGGGRHAFTSVPCSQAAVLPAAAHHEARSSCMPDTKRSHKGGVPSSDRRSHKTAQLAVCRVVGWWG
jgi:hypothetical protein